MLLTWSNLIRFAGHDRALILWLSRPLLVSFVFFLFVSQAPRYLFGFPVRATPVIINTTTWVC
jgi:hypothetical protein